MTETLSLDGLQLDQRQTIAYQEWQRLSSDDKAPQQQDFRPERVARALPAATLLHVEKEGTRVRFRQRLEGRFVTLAFGEGLGNDVEEIYTDPHLEDMMPRYLESALTGDPAMTRCTAPKRDGSPFDFTRLILPFTGPDGAVNRLLVVFYFDAVELARLSGPLMIRREATQDSNSFVAFDPNGIQQARQAG